jgi:hypothetical protein
MNQEDNNLCDSDKLVNLHEQQKQHMLFTRTKNFEPREK